MWLALGVMTGTARAQDAGRGRGRGFGSGIQSTDPRVQNRTCHFADTSVDLPYCVFVSSKVSKDRKNRLHVPRQSARSGGRGRLHPGCADGVRRRRLVRLAGDEEESQSRLPGATASAGQPGGVEREGRIECPRDDAAEWAAIAAMAPAAFLMNDNRGAILQKIKDGGAPEIFAFFKEHLKPAR